MSQPSLCLKHYLLIIFSSYAYLQLAKLKEFADNEDYLIRIDETFLEKTLTEGDAEARIAPIEINDNRTITPYSPYQHSKFKLVPFPSFCGLICVFCFHDSLSGV